MAKKIPKRSKPVSRTKSAPVPKTSAVRKKGSSPPVDSESHRPLFPIVGVGASAGGLEAFTEFLKRLPSDSGMAFVLIQHLDPKQHSGLTDLLSKATKMPVLEVRSDTAIEADHIYVMAPGLCLSMSDGYIRVDKRGPGRNLPIDLFLKSLAQDNTSKAIGIVLSGTASDGTLGLKAVKAEGGITFAQEPSSAKFDGMPSSAIAAGVVDFVLPPGEIATRLVRLAKHPYVALKALEGEETSQETESSLIRIFELLRKATGNDFTHYKHTTIQRRIKRRMVLHASEALSDYVVYLRENPAEVRALAEDLLVCVTSFFREPEALEALSAKVFPEIIKKKSPEDSIRIWVPGCATGEEAYSVAICLTEFLDRSGANVPFQVFATDISESAIEKARAGLYPTAALAEVTPARLKRFFVKVSGGYQIAKTIRDGVLLAAQNVIKDPPFHNLDLITCRNVLIYFGPVLQKKALSTFHYALKPGGFLLLGHSETVSPVSHAFSSIDKKIKLYSKQTRGEPLTIAADDTRSQSAKFGSEASSIRTPFDIQKAAERILLSEYAPVGVIVDDALNVVHVRGDTGAYLQVATGEPSYSLLKMAREGLVVSLRASVLKAKQTKTSVSQQVRVRQGGVSKEVRLRVVPIDGPGISGALHFLILFEEIAPTDAPAPLQSGQDDKSPQKTRPSKANASRKELTQLRQELASTKEYLHSIIEQQEASSEELKSANEEAQASNEELETSKEELQSSNEELNTVNEELKTRNFALNEVNNDLKNVLTSINVPLVMVGRDLKIKRFTQSMEPMLNLIESDTGRSISDLKPNIDLPDLPELLRGVVSGGRSSPVRDVQGPKGRWYSLQAVPFRGPDNKLDGALMVMLDTDAIKRGRDFAQAVVETVREPLIILSGKLKVRTANQAFYNNFNVEKEETEDCFLYDLGNGQWNIPDLRKALEKILPEKGTIENFEVRHNFPSIGPKTMLLNAREIKQAEPFGGPTILLAIEDISDRASAQRDLKESETRYHQLSDRSSAVMNNVMEGLYTVDTQGMLTFVNPAAEKMFGWSSAELIGKKIHEVIHYKHPDGTPFPAADCASLPVLKNGTPLREQEDVFIRKDGSFFPVI
jgi:two-component system CheB/CheR fusion protein